MSALEKTLTLEEAVDAVRNSRPFEVADPNPYARGESMEVVSVAAVVTQLLLASHRAEAGARVGGAGRDAP